MSTKEVQMVCSMAVAAALALTGIACNDSSSVLSPPSAGGGGASSLTVSGSSPAGGDGTITDVGTLIVNNGGMGYDELNLSETGHDLTINWDTTTMAIHSVQHGWGAGIAQCVAGTAPCDPAKIVIDVAGHTVTFTNLALTDDPFSTGSTCTIDGVARW